MKKTILFLWYVYSDLFKERPKEMQYFKDNSGMITGIVLGSVFGTIALSAVLVYLVKWRKMRTSCK